jgi:excisionase family DNA binding protein
MNKCYSVKALSELLGVKPLTVYRLLKAGKIQAFRVGRAVRVEQRAIDAFIESARIIPPKKRR